MWENPYARIKMELELIAMWAVEKPEGLLEIANMRRFPKSYKKIAMCFLAKVISWREKDPHTKISS